MILGIDFETTSLNTDTLEITEIGAILMDEISWKPVMIFNTLIQGPIVPDEITELTGLTTELLDTYGVPLDESKKGLMGLVDRADWLVAHNATNFDKKIYERVFTDLPKRPWIDTSVDVPYPERMTTRKLEWLAAAHGFVNPFSHRTVFDVLTMLKVMSSYSFDGVTKLALEPSVNVRAVIDYQHREKAKERGYRWDAVNKSWIKTLKQSQFEIEKIQAGFEVRSA